MEYNDPLASGNAPSNKEKISGAGNIPGDKTDVLKKPRRSTEERRIPLYRELSKKWVGTGRGSAGGGGFLIYLILLKRQKFLHCSVGSYYLFLHKKNWENPFFSLHCLQHSSSEMLESTTQHRIANLVFHTAAYKPSSF